MKVFCILGDERVAGLRSPAMFSAVLKRIGMQAVYVPFRVAPDAIGQAIQSLRVLNIAGANITIPFKEAVIPHLDILSEGANIIGAINTIVCNGTSLKGYNTNAIGFMDALGKADFDVAGKSALVFGSGGAAKTVAFVLNWLRAASILVAGRNLDKTAKIAERFGGQVSPLAQLAERPLSVDIIVNATAISSPHESPLLAELVEKLQIPGCQLVMDLNYGRQKNIWQQLARKNEVPFMDGLPALAYQARRTLALWTGVQVAPEEFLKALELR